MRYTISLSLASLAMATPGLTEVPRVVTDIPPVHALVAQVMGDLGTPELLLDKGANAHSFQLRPSQAQALADAGLVVWIGPEMTPWLDRTLDGMGVQAAQLRLLDAPGSFTLSYGEDGEHDHGAEGAESHGAEAHDDHAAEGHEAATDAGGDDHAHAEGDDHAGHAEGDAHAGHNHAAHTDADAPDDGEDHHEAGDHAGGEEHHHAGRDPHAWLDPANAAVWMDAIAVELGRLDPENATTYATNAATGQARVAALDAEVAGLLGPVQGKPIVVFHDAYNYFTGHYGLNVVGTVALGDVSSPGAQRLADLRAGLEGGSALCIFPEAQHDPKLVAQMADGTGVTIGGALDPEGSALEPGAGLYADLLRGLATTIADCVTKG